ncbi:anaerobic C4-dicarboxylate transporter [Telmatospirillum sp.]|uniref:anaerobic C4-dicarboxylate transporter n=1 Tax=Telmatospirillum sp. TaxID=2079197 RepID=UPI00284703F5|nr:anaerobic C4-dicarboxylate transporter [Telmatospirillum sp.]MDR3440083.1 anaerobic C4-dicarboxylate transporter [Telmatospirillum sp.]
MDTKLIIEFLVVLAAIAIGARKSGVALGLWGGVGLFLLVVVFGVKPTSPPIDVMLIILAVIMAASVMEAAGGIDYLVRVAERLIRSNPKQVTIIAPLVTWTFTFLAGTGHIVYPLLPVIHEVARKAGIRPERPMAIATIASQQGITGSPVSAATAAMIGLFAEHGMNGWGLAQILMISVPSTLIGVLFAAVLQTKVGKELIDDPEYRALVASGAIEPVDGAAAARPDLPNSAKYSAWIFLVGVAVVVLTGLFPQFRIPIGGKEAMGMPIVIEIVMMSIAAILMILFDVKADLVPRTATCRAGLVALVGIFGLAWLGDTFIAGNKEIIVGQLSSMATAAPWTFSFGLFFASVLLYSQAATARALMPLGVTLGIAPAALIAMFPAVNGYFFIPTYGTLIAAINFDRCGTTRIGRFVLNHSFMLPGLISTAAAVAVGLLIAHLI